MKTTLPLLLASFFLLSASKVHLHHYPGVKKQFVPVPAGTVSGQTVSSFYISATEVTNSEYRLFLYDLQSNRETEKLKLAMVDTLMWGEFEMKNVVYVHRYFQNAAFDYYPVVNISKKGAELYAEWATEKYNEVSKEKVKYALPTEVQWILAARGGSPDAVYGWTGNSLSVDKKGKYYGESLGNYRHNYNPGKNIKNNPNADVTAPSASYLPNAYGIRNMSGNVAEILADKDYTKGGSWWSDADKLKINATENYSGPSPTVGFRLVMIKEPSK